MLNSKRKKINDDLNLILFWLLKKVAFIQLLLNASIIIKEIFKNEEKTHKFLFVYNH